MSTPYTGKKPMHKHRNLIIAWANGAEIEERQYAVNGWLPWVNFSGTWAEHTLTEYRIKPEPKPDFITFLYWSLSHKEWRERPKIYPDASRIIALTRDGQTLEIKSVELWK